VERTEIGGDELRIEDFLGLIDGSSDDTQAIRAAAWPWRT
jgi:hypothetical protein